MPAKVALTGSRGWIGGMLLRRLRERGQEVICLHHETPAAELAEAAAVCDVVVHAGGVYSGDRIDTISGNIEQAVAVAKGCSNARNTVVFLSSVKVYGWADREGQIRDEQSPTPAQGHFALAKRLVEDLLALLSYRSYALRIANAYGRGIPRKYAIGTMFDSARRNGRIVLDCDGRSLRDFVHVQDVIRVIEQIILCAHAHPPGRYTFNVSSGRLVSLMEVAQLFTRHLGTRVETLGGTALASPLLPSRRAVEAGLIDAFCDPLRGIDSLVQEWKETQ